MKDRKTTVFANGLIWFGAAVSIAEIITGTYYAPLGMGKGLAAIFIGHVIGCVLLFMAGIIGGKTERSAMETVKMSFGRRGGLLFCLLNVIQLVGWTSIMIFQGAAAANVLLVLGAWAWCLIIGGLILLWIFIGIRNLGKLNVVAMTLLFLLTLVLSKVIFLDGGMGMTVVGSEGMKFGMAVELSVAMPLSWLPLISDYTREAEKPVAATLASVLTYGLVSCWMFAIGMGASIFAGSGDMAQIMLKAGLGVIGLIIVVLSTVTTTFLDAYSAGVSSVSLTEKINEKWAAIAVGVIGTLAAIFFPMEDITGFLYFIGSVFAPMVAVLLTDYFILGKSHYKELFAPHNLVIWLVGFVIYRWMMDHTTPLGYTLPTMVIVGIICVIVDKALLSRR
ncbi:MAG: putative hydroxymethylpyrimidine transporter CytX [Anaerovoracaceae bacterium]